ncbi:beta-ketoacyl synthase N-terminal-like domain-containing protein [soil metagenome]
MSYPVYISSTNIISPLGNSTDANFKQIIAGKTALKQATIEGARPIEACAAIINESEIEQTLSPLQQVYTRFEKLLIISIGDALKNAGIDAAAPRTAFVLSTTKGNIDMLHEGLYPNIHPNRIYLAQAAKAVSECFHNPNTPMVISNACISGVMALIMGARLIRSGQYDHVIACGGDIINDFTASGFQSFKALSDVPCKPFDKDRNGLNLGEAFGTVILSAQPTEGAIKVLGGASSNDANHISGPSRNGSGLKVAIQATLKESSLHTNQINMVSAHGTATPYNDEMESIALDDLGFGQVPVNSLKGYFGHTLGGAGLVETIISAESLRQQMLLKTLGYESHGVSRPTNITTATLPYSLNTCLKTASGFGGCNAALILQRA